MSNDRAGEWHPAAEEYCEAIFLLDEEQVSVLPVRLAERLGVSRPSVSEQVRHLRRDGLVEPGDGPLVLTEEGRALAERVVRRHRLAERFLTDVLELPPAVADHEAGKWEHVISDRVEAALAEVLGHPTTCPRGRPIPGAGREGLARGRPRPYR